jgi:hypothetical protein
MESANARLFSDWRSICDQISATPNITNDEVGAVCGKLYIIENEMLTLPAETAETAETAEKVCRLVLVALEQPFEDSNSHAAILWRRAAQAVGNLRQT